MSSLLKRIILFFTAIPLLFSLIYFLPHYHHLGFVVLTIGAMVISGWEMKRMLFGANRVALTPFWATALFPLVEYIRLTFEMRAIILEFTAIVLLVALFSKEIYFGSKEEFDFSLKRISYSLFLLIYPGFFSIFLIKLLWLPNSTMLLLLLFLLVFGNDTFSYVFGMWLGRRSRNVVAVSPNKSLVGYIGGALVTVAISIAWCLSFSSMRGMFSWYHALILGLIVAFTGNIGDLIESTIKRGSQVKDSGVVVLGRGGILDSIDSLIASVPFFYAFILLFL